MYDFIRVDPMFFEPFFLWMKEHFVLLKDLLKLSNEYFFYRRRVLIENVNFIFLNKF